jgi:hypothetical protein
MMVIGVQVIFINVPVKTLVSVKSVQAFCIVEEGRWNGWTLGCWSFRGDGNFETVG